MTTKVIPLLVLVLASSGSFSAAAEATANSDYAAAEKAAKEAEAAVGPLKDAMQKADTACGQREGSSRHEATAGH